MNHSVVIRDFKGDYALDEFNYFIVLYVPSRPWFFSRNAAEISTHIFKVYYYFIYFILM